MSKITNTQGLPEPLVRAVTYSDYNKEGCDYSVSELLRPARMVALEQIHRDEITEDASDRLWLLLGSAGHTVLERSAHKGIVEERAIVEVEVDGKMFKVGGKLDYGISEQGELCVSACKTEGADNPSASQRPPLRSLWDYKFTSVWAAKEGPREEWIAQLNIYAWLARRYGVAFDKLQIVAIFRDWSKPKASREPDYPQAQVKVFDLPLWRDDTTEQFIIDRIRAHEAAKVTLPECSPEEMWEKPGCWAVMKKGGKRAVKLYETPSLAHQHASEDFGLYVEHRPAERTRCESYCRLGGDSGLCEQWVKFKQTHP